ncbi:MAG TPA: hypothetical protein VLF39_03050 [Candidatus Saccharimonadales bacterium]|nr:hypothetical protein [Candidatus Saccharimonadales bacterium]
MAEVLLERDPTVELTPAEYLGNLPHEGFTSEEQRQQVIEQIDAIGFPVNNFRSLSYEKNDKGRETILGSWDPGVENRGRFSVYELLNRQVPEKRIGTIAHESTHANSALVPENAHLYGGEAERAEAEKYIKDVAGQTLLTGKYLNSYQKHLAKQLDANKIDVTTFVEETQAIVSELAITNRAHLAQVETAQHDKLRKMYPNETPVNLISHKDKDGNVQVDGIDRQLITLIRGVSSYEDLETHVTGLKEQFYPSDSIEKVHQRQTNQR